MIAEVLVILVALTAEITGPTVVTPVPEREMVCDDDCTLLELSTRMA
jgi:hypothetical protein